MFGVRDACLVYRTPALELGLQLGQRDPGALKSKLLPPSQKFRLKGAEVSFSELKSQLERWGTVSETWDSLALHPKGTRLARQKGGADQTLVVWNDPGWYFT